MKPEVLLDARLIPARDRHPRIFKAWEELPVGGAIRLLNDHDPKPLYYEFEAERAGEFEWTPLQCGPDFWSVLIRRVGAAERGGPVSLGMTVNEAAARWPRAQAVLARYGLDTCCGGAHPIEFAARAHGIDAQKLLRELNSAAEGTPEPAPPSTMSDQIAHGQFESVKEEASMNREVLLDVRKLAPRMKHPTIFRIWEELPVGGAIRLLNDHDPKPLRYEFQAERPGEFEWRYIESGPEQWCVLIERVAPAKNRGREGAAGRPSWADAGGPELDVREALRSGGEPFGDIMARAEETRPGEVFVLRALFDPRPLYQALGAKGFEAWTERLAADDWKVYFRKKTGAAPSAPGKTVTLDVSALEPPEPMVRILEAVPALGPSDVLEVTHHREPVPLYARLEEAGFSHEIERLGENSYRLRIRRKSAIR